MKNRRFWPLMDEANLTLAAYLYINISAIPVAPPAREWSDRDERHGR